MTSRLCTKPCPRMSLLTVQTSDSGSACCTIPPVQFDYTPQGSFRALGDFQKVYITGPEKSDINIVCVLSMISSGADIVSKTLNTTVYMPDFFEPHAPFHAENFPPKTEGTKAGLQAFFKGPANASAVIDKLVSFGRILRDVGAKKIGVYGFCWGGKVAISAGGPSTPFDAISIIHPAFLSAPDAEKLTLPLGLYISNDESSQEYQKILEVTGKTSFASKNDHKHYTIMQPGWAAARADLKNEENKDYADVYE